MLKIMQPVDLFKLPPSNWDIQNQLDAQQHKLIEDFTKQFNQSLEQNMKSILGNAGTILFQLLPQRLPSEDLINKLKNIADQLKGTYNSTESYLSMAKNINISAQKTQEDKHSPFTS